MRAEGQVRRLTGEWPSSARALGCDAWRASRIRPAAPSLAACCRCVAPPSGHPFVLPWRSVPRPAEGCSGARGTGRSARPGKAKRPTPAGCGDGKGVRRQRMSRWRLEDEGDAGCGRQRDRGRQDSRRFGRARVMSQWMKARMDPQSNGGHHKLSISDCLRVSG
jgi:hypothetical protein